MCNRYIAPEQDSIERVWQLGRDQNVMPWQPGIYPRSDGPFIRASEQRELVVGQWGLIPGFAKSRTLKYSTNNARSEGIESKPSFRQAWRAAQRCIIPAESFDEPCWESGRNVWWSFRRADGEPWGLAGLWNRWMDAGTGEIVESYTMLTVNADSHPLMSRMHKPDPSLAADRQDKRSVVAVEMDDVDTWLRGSIESAITLLRAPAMDLIKADPHT